MPGQKKCIPRKTRIKGEKGWLSLPGLQGKPEKVLACQNPVFVAKLDKRFYLFFYTCQWYLCFEPPQRSLKLHSQKKKIQLQHKQTQTLHLQRWKCSTWTDRSFSWEIVYASVPCRKASMMLPFHLTVPGAASWTLRHFGQKMPIIMSPQSVFFC